MSVTFGHKYPGGKPKTRQSKFSMTSASAVTRLSISSNHFDHVQIVLLGYPRSDHAIKALTEA